MDIDASAQGPLGSDVDLVREARAFAEGAGVWLGHLVGGDVGVDEAIRAAQLLLARATRFVEVAA